MSWIGRENERVVSLRAFSLGLALVVSGCGLFSPGRTGNAEGANQLGPGAATPAQAEADAGGGPSVAGAPAAGGAGGVRLDDSCAADDDCRVKDVGNCCGYYPRCVNVGFVPDPAAVLKACEASGVSSVCGWPEITHCRCVERRCRSMQGDQEI